MRNKLKLALSYKVILMDLPSPCCVLSPSSYFANHLVSMTTTLLMFGFKNNSNSNKNFSRRSQTYKPVLGPAYLNR